MNLKQLLELEPILISEQFSPSNYNLCHEKRNIYSFKIRGHCCRFQEQRESVYMANLFRPENGNSGSVIERVNDFILFYFQ